MAKLPRTRTLPLEVSCAIERTLSSYLSRVPTTVLNNADLNSDYISINVFDAIGRELDRRAAASAERKRAYDRKRQRNLKRQARLARRFGLV